MLKCVCAAACGRAGDINGQSECNSCTTTRRSAAFSRYLRLAAYTSSIASLHAQLADLSVRRQQDQKSPNTVADLEGGRAGFAPPSPFPWATDRRRHVTPEWQL